jgi:hypothetical protein
MQVAIAILLVLHGIAHFVGFAGAFQLGDVGRTVHIMSFFRGERSFTEAQVQAFGMLWLTLGLAFICCAALLFFDNPLWPLATTGICIVSGLMCVAFWPEARFGLFVNLAIMLFVLTGLLR